MRPELFLEVAPLDLTAFLALTADLALDFPDLPEPLRAEPESESEQALPEEYELEWDLEGEEDEDEEDPEDEDSDDDALDGLEWAEPPERTDPPERPAALTGSSSRRRLLREGGPPRPDVESGGPDALLLFRPAEALFPPEACVPS